MPIEDRLRGVVLLSKAISGHAGRLTILQSIPKKERRNTVK